MKLLKRVLPMLLCLCLLTILMSASAATPQIVFSASPPDSGGLFTVSVTVYNATFEGIQFSIGFNPDAVSPVSWTTGNTTAAVSECIQKETAAKAMAVFGSLSKDQKKLIVLGYSENDPDFSITAGAGGTKLLSLRFEVTGQGASGLCVAEDAGNGLAYDYKMLPTSFVFELPASLNGGAASSSDTTEPVMTKAERMQNTVILQIGNYAAAKNGALCHIYPGEKKVTPYIKGDAAGNGRTMVPLRFIAEALGAEIGWKDADITITLGKTTIAMKIGRNDYTVNNVLKTMDTAPEIKDSGDGSGNGRTMVPMRFAVEALGKAVFWDNTNKLVIITEPEAEWQPDRSAEKELTSDVLLIISPLLRDTIQ